MIPKIAFPPLAAGFTFGSMSVHCESWEAWDSLLEEDGWVERTSERDGVTHVWKTLGPWPGGYIAVHPPREPRPEVVCVPAVTPAEDEAFSEMRT